jgi:sugar phosphate isomerase/epimerase
VLDIYCSNGFYRDVTVESSVNYFVKNGIDKIEISCGINSKETLFFLKKMGSAGIKFRLHNYFPNLDQDFVLNLASTDDELRKMSKALVVRAIQWSSELASDYYAFHAGFRISPRPSELGGNMIVAEQASFIESRDIFVDQLFEIAVVAKKYGVNIAIENNVYDIDNYARFGDDNPLLLTGDIGSDIANFFPENIGILLDVAHLKVSSETLGFDRHEAIRRWEGKINGLHLSDNDGKKDTNNGFDENSWFWGLSTAQVIAVTIEVYNETPDKLLNYANAIASKINDSDS